MNSCSFLYQPPHFLLSFWYYTAMIPIELAPMSTALDPCIQHKPPFGCTCLWHPSRLHRFITAPCVTQTHPFLGWLVHPSKLHRFLANVAFVPWVQQTPPLITPLVQPSWLHCFFTRLFTFAPCVQHTPPFCAWLVHPSWVQSFLLATWVPHTPPFTTLWVHPSTLHSFRFNSTFAGACVIQVPPVWACLAHPSYWLTRHKTTTHTTSCGEIVVGTWFFKASFWRRCENTSDRERAKIGRTGRQTSCWISSNARVSPCPHHLSTPPALASWLMYFAIKSF